MGVVVDGLAKAGSQFGQDAYLDTYVFNHRAGGTFLEIGAYDGTSGSNTLLFEQQRGWTGLLVEPDPALAAQARERRASPCLEVAVAAQVGSTEFLSVTDGYRQMGGLIETYDVATLEIVRAVAGHTEQVHEVAVVTFVELIEQLGTGLSNTDHIDLISLDIEGGESAALDAFPFETVSVGAWLIENMSASPDLADRMHKHGYGLVRRLGVDEVYVPVAAIDEIHAAEGWTAFSEGVELLEAAQHPQAVQVFRSLVTDDDLQADAWNNLGIALRNLDQLDDALAANRRAYELDGVDGVIRRGLQCTLAEAGLFDQVLDIGQQVADPEQADLAHLELGRFELAHAAGDVDSALAAIDRRVEHGYDEQTAEFDRAATMLASVRVPDGFACFEARRGVGDNFPTFDQLPEWLGEPLDGAGLLVVGEQGFGDYVFFARWLRELPSSTTVAVACPGPLRRLFEHDPAVSQVFDLIDSIPLEPFSYWVPMGSLANRLGCDRPIAPWSPRLPASSSERARSLIRDDAGSAAAENLRVGLVWTGRDDTASLRRRHLPLESLAPLLQVPGVSWYSLAKGKAGDELASSPYTSSIVDIGSSDTDLADCAAVCAELDLVISVCTFSAHLAASAGTPTWVLLHDRPFWLWGHGRSHSDWYPSVRLFRQPQPDDWTTVVADAAAALSELR